jgi:excisionase family DNA binding protein
LEELFSVTEAARRAGGLSKWTVYAWCSQGRLQRTKVGGRTMIKASDLAKFIEESTKSQSPRQRQSEKPGAPSSSDVQLPPKPNSEIRNERPVKPRSRR